MMLDKAVFGHTKFDITDTDLFNDGSHEPVYVQLQDNTNTGNAAGRASLVAVDYCQTVTITYVDCPYQGHGACTPVCDRCPLCMRSIALDYCWTEWEDDGGGGSTGTGGGGNTGGGGGGGTPPSPPCSGGKVYKRPEGDPPPCGPGWEPIEDDGSGGQNPCGKVKTVVNDPANATGMQKVRDLVSAQNLGLDYEKIVTLTTATPPVISEGSGTNSVASAQLPDIPGQKYQVFAHTHPNAPGGTYSVFSYGDLQRMSNLLHKGQLNANKFTAFLGTYKGTYYALTIDNVSKLEDFFYYFNNDATAAQGDITKWIQSQTKALMIQDKYFNNIDNALITETDTDNNNVLSKFLDFMKEANLGVTLFETDAAFSSFTKVEKQGNGAINRTPCN